MTYIFLSNGETPCTPNFQEIIDISTDDDGYSSDVTNYFSDDNSHFSDLESHCSDADMTVHEVIDNDTTVHEVIDDDDDMSVQEEEEEPTYIETPHGEFSQYNSSSQIHISAHGKVYREEKEKTPVKPNVIMTRSRVLAMKY